MNKEIETKGEELSAKSLEKLRNELWIALPLFAFSLFMFLGSFLYRFEASVLPMVIGFGTSVGLGMRLLYVIFPRSKIGKSGKFREESLSAEFDRKRDEVKKEIHFEEHYIEETEKEITNREELKAFISLIICCASFLLFGYLVGIFFALVGTSYYYGYKEKGPLLICLASLYFIIYVILHKVMEAPADYGLVLKPILISLGLI